MTAGSILCVADAKNRRPFIRVEKSDRVHSAVPIVKKMRRIELIKRRNENVGLHFGQRIDSSLIVFAWMTW